MTDTKIEELNKEFNERSKKLAIEYEMRIKLLQKNCKHENTHWISKKEDNSFYYKYCCDCGNDIDIKLITPNLKLLVDKKDQEIKEILENMLQEMDKIVEENV